MTVYLMYQTTVIITNYNYNSNIIYLFKFVVYLLFTKYFDCIVYLYINIVHINTYMKLYVTVIISSL